MTDNEKCQTGDTITLVASLSSQLAAANERADAAERELKQARRPKAYKLNYRNPLVKGLVAFAAEDGDFEKPDPAMVELVEQLAAVERERDEAQTACVAMHTFVAPFVKTQLALLGLCNIYWHPPTQRHSHSPSIWQDEPELVDAAWKNASEALESATTPGSHLGGDIFHKAYGMCENEKAGLATNPAELEQAQAACVAMHKAACLARRSISSNYMGVASETKSNQMDQARRFLDPVCDQPNPGKPIIDRMAELETALRSLRDEIRDYNPTDIDLGPADAALAGLAEMRKDKNDG